MKPIIILTVLLALIVSEEAIIPDSDRQDKVWLCDSKDPGPVGAYIKHIENLINEGRLTKKSFPNMSFCGGSLHGYYQNDTLVCIKSVYSGELGYTSRTYYLKDNEFLAINYLEHAAEWDVYNRKYPLETHPFDITKMTFSDVVYQFELTDKTVCTKTEKGRSVAVDVNHLLLSDLIKCGNSMREELNSVEAND